MYGTEGLFAKKLQEPALLFDTLAANTSRPLAADGFHTPSALGLESRSGGELAGRHWSLWWRAEVSTETCMMTLDQLQGLMRKTSSTSPSSIHAPFARGLADDGAIGNPRVL